MTSQINQVEPGRKPHLIMIPVKGDARYLDTRALYARRRAHKFVIEYETLSFDARECRHDGCDCGLKMAEIERSTFGWQVVFFDHGEMVDFSNEDITLRHAKKLCRDKLGRIFEVSA